MPAPLVLAISKESFSDLSLSLSCAMACECTCTYLVTDASCSSENRHAPTLMISRLSVTPLFVCLQIQAHHDDPQSLMTSNVLAQSCRGLFFLHRVPAIFRHVRLLDHFQ
eukprot:scpid18909/ scgid10836/ 